MHNYETLNHDEEKRNIQATTRLVRLRGDNDSNYISVSLHNSEAAMMKKDNPRELYLKFIQTYRRIKILKTLYIYGSNSKGKTIEKSRMSWEKAHPTIDSLIETEHINKENIKDMRWVKWLSLTQKGKEALHKWSELSEALELE
jgi:DNA-binding MarR family transcriptional regulator